MKYLNRLNTSARDIKDSEEYGEFEGLAGVISEKLASYHKVCAEDSKKPECLSKEADVLHDIHTYINYSHDFVEKMIVSLDVPAETRYALFKAQKFGDAKAKPIQDNTTKTIGNLFDPESSSYSLQVLTGLKEVFTPMPDHAHKLEIALAKRIGDLESNYIFLKGAKHYLTSLAQLKYTHLSVQAVESRMNSMDDQLSFIQNALFGEFDALEGDERPAALKVLEKLKKENSR